MYFVAMFFGQPIQLNYKKEVPAKTVKFLRAKVIFLTGSFIYQIFYANKMIE